MGDDAKETSNEKLIWRGQIGLVDENGNDIPPDKGDWDYTTDEDKCMYNEAYCKKPTKIKKKKKKKVEKKGEVMDKQDTAHEVQEAHTQEQPTTATVGVPSMQDNVANLKGMIPNAGNDMVTVILSGIAVMGGATAWKFYSQKSANTHEERMKKLELESQSSNNHQACSANNAMLGARIDALEGKLAKVESSTINLSGGGLDDLEERLEKVEKLVKRSKKSTQV